MWVSVISVTCTQALFFFSTAAMVLCATSTSGPSCALLGLGVVSVLLISEDLSPFPSVQ